MIYLIYLIYLIHLIYCPKVRRPNLEIEMEIFLFLILKFLAVSDDKPWPSCTFQRASWQLKGWKAGGDQAREDSVLACLEKPPETRATRHCRMSSSQLTSQQTSQYSSWPHGPAGGTRPASHTRSALAIRHRKFPNREAALRKKKRKKKKQEKKTLITKTTKL